MVASRWLKLSPPLLIGLGVVAVIFLIAFARWLGGVSLWIAGVLWVSAGIGVLHASSRLRWTDRYPSVSRLLALYTSSPGYRLSPSPPPVIEDEVGEEVDVSRFVGLEDVWQKINAFLDSKAVIPPPAQPATLVLLVGQKGTGKSSVSRALALALHERGMVKSNHIETIPVTTAPGLVDSYGPTPEAHNTVSAGMQRALDGVLRIEDIDATPSVSTGQALAAIGSQLLAIARTYPHRLFVICTGSATAVAPLQPYLGQLDVHRIEFADLSDESLGALFVQLVQERGLRLADNAESALRYATREIKKEQGNAFENAYTMHKLFDQVIYEWGVRISGSPGLPERERNIIQREDIQAAQRH